MHTLYDSLTSGNGYKVRLLLHQLRVPFRRVQLDLHAGESRREAFLRKNPEGRIPVLELPDGTCLAESNAVACYLAEGTPLLPADRLARAQVLQWLFWEQYSHEPNIATVRHWVLDLPPDPAREPLERQKRALGVKALGVMERWLEGRDWFAAGRYTVADVALYAYTHVAGQGGFDLGPFPRVRAWIGRVAAEPGHVPITLADGYPRG